ncbi:MAG: DNA-binding domain-containing protein [Gallionella sp.]|nr:DNA-binding domain-containing protein [Gallionella sp.]
MSEYTDELAHFARAIVCCESPSQKVCRTYPDYTAATAMEVYRNNYRGNLHDALAVAYPVILQLVGDDFFRFMARKYIGEHPSQSANLHHYGAELAAFLSGFAPAQELPYLPDVARLEWHCHLAYFAPDAPSFSLAYLAEIPAEHYAELSIGTACRMVRSDFPVMQIWQAHQPGADSDFRIDLDNGGGIALVSRKEYVIRVSELPEAAACWLQHIQDGDTLGLATHATLERHPRFDLQATLINLLAQGALTSFTSAATS